MDIHRQDDPLDADKLRELREVMGDRFPALLAAWIRDGEARIAAMRLALQAADTARLASEAHALKGTSLNLGAQALAAASAAVEAAARTGDLAAAPAALEAVLAAWRRVITRLAGEQPTAG